MAGASPRKRWTSTLVAWAVSSRASSSPNSPVAAPARAMADWMRWASNAARVPSRWITSRGRVATGVEGGTMEAPEHYI